MFYLLSFIFFFSSRRRHTRYIGDWIQTCALPILLGKHSGRHALERRYRELGYEVDDATLRKLYDEFTTLADKKREILDEDLLTLLHGRFRSEERRVGKECRAGWSPEHYKKMDTEM